MAYARQYPVQRPEATCDDSRLFRLVSGAPSRFFLHLLFFVDDRPILVAPCTMMSARAFPVLVAIVVSSPCRTSRRSPAPARSVVLATTIVSRTSVTIASRPFARGFAVTVLSGPTSGIPSFPSTPPYGCGRLGTIVRSGITMIAFRITTGMRAFHRFLCIAILILLFW